MNLPRGSASARRTVLRLPVELLAEGSSDDIEHQTAPLFLRDRTQAVTKALRAHAPAGVRMRASQPARLAAPAHRQ
jgi:hypothetical protein